MVYNLTDNNFHSVVKDSDPWFLEFFAPWCGHCKRFAPIFTEASDHELTKDIHFGAIDATENKEIANEFDVHSYPTIYFAHKERKFRFRSDRTVDGVINYLTQMMSSPVEKKQAEEIELGLYEVTFVLTHDSPEVKEAFKELAYSYLDKNFVRFIVGDGPKQMIRYEKGRKSKTLADPLDLESMKKFVEESYEPTVRRIRGYSEFRPIARSTANTFMYVIPSDEHENGAHQVLNSLVDSESINQDEFTWNIVRYENLQVLLSEQLNLSKEDAPLLIIYHDRSAGFVVQAANPEGKTSEQAAHDIVQSIQEDTAEWIYVLPFYQRATRFFQAKMDDIGKFGQLVISAATFACLFGCCWCLDGYFFPDTYDEIIEKHGAARKKRVEEAAKKEAEEKEEEPKKEK